MDLRDGVKLTRLVELLLYSSAAASRLSEDATITSPDSELLLNSLRQKEFWTLSSHLKVPCAAKSQKIHNVQIALDALSGSTAVTSFAKVLRADDIVDGYREKTVGLLWALVSRIGLSTLVDWKELEKETRRLQKRSSEDPIDGEAEPRSQETFYEHASALIAWAGSIARLHQLTLENIRTAFADGKIFEKIVDEYATYLPYSQSERTETCSKSTGLESKLRRMGCNRYFVSTFARSPYPGHVFERNFIVAALTFLASRLLCTSRACRAALVIQQAYRRTLGRRHLHRRGVLMKLAYDCQMVVLTRERILDAAKVLQRAWRSCLAMRLNRLIMKTVSLQAKARGMIVRGRLAVEEEAYEDIWLP